MAHAVNAAADTTPSVARAGATWWPVFAVLAVLWLLLVRQLRFEWTINPQYNYGFIVPLLAAYLFLERWKYRPPAGSAGPRSIVAALLTLCVLMLFPLRLIQESAPDWRLVGWALGGACVVITLGALWRAGGFPWVRHFAFPVAFFLIAVPWPVPFEQALVQWLMRSVTGICVEALSWVEIPAVQKGNVIEIATGRVGVEEACSGVRSLQTTLMISLFMGELLRFGFLRRAILLLGGLGVAYVCNASRAFFLVWVSAKEGTGAVAKWHDSVGMAVLAGSLAGVGILCLVLNLLRKREGGDALDPEFLQPAPPPARSVLMGFAVWLVFIEGATEVWYRVHESRTPSVAAWKLDWPAAQPGFRDLPFSEITRSILRYSEARAGAWSDAQGRPWTMFFIRWEPGRTSSQLARSHGPEICLAAGGWAMKEDHGLRPMRIQGIDLPMRAYTFQVRGQTAHVFYCLWEQRADSDAAQSVAIDLTVGKRLADVRKGVRNSGQQAIELAVMGYESPADAEAAVKGFLERSIQP